MRDEITFQQPEEGCSSGTRHLAAACLRCRYCPGHTVRFPWDVLRFVRLPWPAASRAYLVLKPRERPISAEYAICVRDARKKKQGDAGSTLVTGGGRVDCPAQESATRLLLSCCNDTRTLPASATRDNCRRTVPDESSRGGRDNRRAGGVGRRCRVVVLGAAEAALPTTTISVVSHRTLAATSARQNRLGRLKSQ